MPTRIAAMAGGVLCALALVVTSILYHRSVRLPAQAVRHQALTSGPSDGHSDGPSDGLSPGGLSLHSRVPAASTADSEVPGLVADGVCGPNGDVKVILTAAGTRTPLRDVEVQLELSVEGGMDQIRRASSDSCGAALFTSLEPGEWTVRLPMTRNVEARANVEPGRLVEVQLQIEIRDEDLLHVLVVDKSGNPVVPPENAILAVGRAKSFGNRPSRGRSAR